MLYLSGIILSFFLSFLLLTKKKKSYADFILVAWLFFLGFHLLSFYLLYTGQQSQYAIIIGLGVPLPLAHGPFLFLYTRQQTSARPFKGSSLLHFLPLLLSYAIFLPFFLLTPAQQAAVFTQHGKPFALQSLITANAAYVSGVAYTGLSLFRLLRYRRRLVDQFSNTERINFNWLLYLIIWMVIIWAIVLFTQKNELIFGAAALFAVWIAFFGIRQVQVYSPLPHQAPAPTVYQVPIEQTLQTVQEAHTISEAVILPNEPAPVSKYQKSTLSEAEAALIHGRLLRLLDEEKPFSDPELTLNDLATRLDVHPNILSQVINSREGKSFYDLINAGRVEEFIRRMSTSDARQFTLLGVAFDCGFNSKASFNRNFKKYTGLTPSEYLKEQLS